MSGVCNFGTLLTPTPRDAHNPITRSRGTSFAHNMLLVILFFLLCENHSSTEAKFATANICREGSLDFQEPIAAADIIVIGSGPGGTGFLHRLVRESPNTTVLWIEKGADFVATNWPKDLEAVYDRVLTPIQRTNKNLIAYAWNNFGGGDAGNSGGPNYVGLERSDEAPYEPVDVVKLRNNSVTPLTPTSERWMKVFTEAGFVNEGPIYSRQTNVKRVGQLSSLRTEDGRDRLLLANDLRYSDANHITYVHARVTSIIHEKFVDEQGRVSLRASGVRGVRVAQDDQGEYGGCVTWGADKAVVLAGGVFNSFDVLVESGLGPEEALNVRKVPGDWRYPNDQVGKEVGDQFYYAFVSVEPEEQDQFGSEARLIAETPIGSGSYEMWSHGSMFLAKIQNVFRIELNMRLLVRFFPWVDRLFTRILSRTIVIAVSLFHEPNMILSATPKPLNATNSRSTRYNPLGMKLDDSMIEMTTEKCQNLTAMMEPLRKAAKLRKEAKKKGSFPRLRPTGQGRKKGTKCSMDRLGSYYHFYGGNANAVNAKYILKGTQNLFISDASIIKSLIPGATSTVIMQQGMKVADALIGTLG